MERIFFAALLIAVITAGYCQEQDCSQCSENACDDAECPRYDHYPARRLRCVQDNCTCEARWYLGAKDITRSCPLLNCDTRDCGKRMCVEEPRECNSANGLCPRRFTTTCVPVPPRQPSTCDNVLCSGNKPVCVVIQTARGSEAVCRGTRREPRNCSELECDDGLECTMRVRKNGESGRPEPVCVFTQETRDQLRGEDCLTLECRDGMVCEINNDNGRARCVRAPVARTCEELTCDRDYRCREEDRRAVCVLSDSSLDATSCRDMDCPEDYVCRMVGNRVMFGRDDFVPRCVPEDCPVRRRPRSCREVVCGRGRECRMEEIGEPRCVRRGPDDDRDRTRNDTDPRPRPTPRPDRPDDDRSRRPRPTPRPDDDRSRRPRPTSRPDDDRSRRPRPTSRPDDDRSRRPRPTSRPDEDRSRRPRPTSRPDDDRSRMPRPTPRPDEDRSHRPRPTPRPDDESRRPKPTPRPDDDRSCRPRPTPRVNRDRDDDREREDDRDRDDRRRLPSKCLHLSCCTGFRCEERERQCDNGTVALCLPETPRPAQTCAELRCEEDFFCQEGRDENGRRLARCVSRDRPDRPTDRTPTRPPTGPPTGTTRPPTRPPTGTTRPGTPPTGNTIGTVP